MVLTNNKFESRGTKVAIFMNRKNGDVIETIIDNDDFEKANELNGSWYASWDTEAKSFYVQGNIKRDGLHKVILLHRLILGTPKGLVVDHINHDTLDNTRENIRSVTNSENMQNLKLHPANTSGFRGVSWNKGVSKWVVRLGVNGKRLHLGYYSDINIASKVADEARTRLMPGFIKEVC